MRITAVYLILCIEQVPIPSYLFAIAVGAIESRYIYHNNPINLFFN